METLLHFLANVAFTGFTLWFAAKVTSVDLQLKETSICAAAAATASLVPSVGGFLAIFVLLILLVHFSRADIFPDLVVLLIMNGLVLFLVYLLFQA